MRARKENWYALFVAPPRLSAWKAMAGAEQHIIEINAKILRIECWPPSIVVKLMPSLAFGLDDVDAEQFG